ncbi:TetR/AcrR family transcriptional regulator [Nocardia mexicana]|uniref:TetR family transcriptional regulator n=1 Tax=Nocardia mexicana TaxID=279262 RepID=A0A370H607_9NOCA|nr:TetR/AcrR family transcriptional regulator [Nocardia mexicana]RDI51644.1 TetR family transcriptional regulator [Nocardia mexicana]
MLDSPLRPAQPGLRERKKLQTRRRIVEVALELCDANGFEATTVEQIAEAADVSPRTVNRYFESKEDIVVAPIEDWGNALAEQLRRQPVIGNELQSLFDAYLAMMDSVITNDEPISFRWFEQTHRIIRVSPTVRAHSLEFVDNKLRATGPVLAERLGTTPDAMQVRMISGIFNAICRTGLECELDDVDKRTAELAVTAVTTAYEEFVRTCAVPCAGARRE